MRSNLVVAIASILICLNAATLAQSPLDQITRIRIFFGKRTLNWSFIALSGGICLPNKKQPDGKKRRRDLLAKCGFEDIDAWLSKLSGSGAMPDDLLDACACAIAADSRGQKLECDRECDAQGLRMEMEF
jgi:predicted RNase H-like nuclease